VTFEPFEALGLSISSTAAVLSQGLEGMRPEALPGIADLVTSRLLPGMDTPELNAAIVRDLSQRTAAYPGGLLSYAIALTLGSPQFQKY
jgi:hypothetical protein